jgi:WD40 repeat protein
VASLMETARAAAPDHLSAGTTEVRPGDAVVVRCPYGPAAAKWIREDTVALLGPNNLTVRTLSTVTRFQPAQLHWSAGCEYLVSQDGRAGRMQVIRVRDGQRRVWKFSEWTKFVPAFSPTEQVMLIASSPQEPPIEGNMDGPSAGKVYYAADIHRIDLAAGRKSNPYKVNGDLSTLAYAPDGKSVALAVDQRVELRSPSDGALRQTLTGHSDRVTALAFAPDGRVLASGSKDTTIFLWQLAP